MEKSRKYNPEDEQDTNRTLQELSDILDRAEKNIAEGHVISHEEVLRESAQW